MQVSLIEILRNMALPVRCVVGLLTLQAIACVAVAIDRLVVLTRSSAQARTFAMSVQSAMETATYKAVLESAALYKGNHFASYLELGLHSFMKRERAGDDATRAAEVARRALERKGDAISRDLNRGMNILASTGSTAPFVGLLGTVLGIINAFKMISLTGSGGLGAIGSSISEALIVTAYGLVVAIPAVLLFNFLSSRIASYEAGLLNAGSELLDHLELDEHRSRNGGQAGRAQAEPSLPRVPAPLPGLTEPPSNPLPGRAR
jgi:biopolymer transport protein ExbB/TolQ